MTLYSNMQICGHAQINVERRDGTVWVRVQDGTQTLTMEARHVRALDQALSAFFDAEPVAAPAPVTAVDAAERVTA